MNDIILLIDTVFPSEDRTVSVVNGDTYGGAHQYIFQNSEGFNNGAAVYVDSEQTIQFVKKEADGSMTPGLQSEQLVIALLDRTKKLNAKFPSEYNSQMIEGLTMYLDACKRRIQDRIDRGVMGKLEK